MTVAKVQTDKLTPDRIEMQAQVIANEPGAIDELRGVIVAMLGPTMFLTNSMLTQPADAAYLDARNGGYGLYTERAVLQTVKIYHRACEIAGVPLVTSKIPNLGMF